MSKKKNYYSKNLKVDEFYLKEARRIGKKSGCPVRVFIGERAVSYYPMQNSEKQNDWYARRNIRSIVIRGLDEREDRFDGRFHLNNKL